MELKNLLEKLTQKQQKTLETAAEKFPKFKQALEEHLTVVESEKQAVSPFETQQAEVFRLAFKEFSELSGVYGQLVSYVLPKKEQKLDPYKTAEERNYRSTSYQSYFSNE